MTRATPCDPSLPHLIVESEVRQRRRSTFSSNSSNLQANSCTSTLAKGGHQGRRSTFPHLFGTPGTTSSIPLHADISSSFAEGDHYVEPFSKQYSPAEEAWDSGYYGTFDSPVKNNRDPLVRSETQKTWEALASPVLNMRKMLAGRPSFLDTSPRKGPLSKVTPQQVLASLVLVLSTISCFLVLFYLTDVGDKDRVVEEKHSLRSVFGSSNVNGLNSKFGALSLEYPDDPQFRSGMRSDSENLEVSLEPLVVGDGQMPGELEERLKNTILEERKRKMLDERKKKMWEKSELLRAKIAEERKERITNGRNKNMQKERVLKKALVI